MRLRALVAVKKPPAMSRSKPFNGVHASRPGKKPFAVIALMLT
jgi:hypothetical protein